MAKKITPKNPATKATTAKTDDTTAERKTSLAKYRGRKSARKTSAMRGK